NLVFATSSPVTDAASQKRTSNLYRTTDRGGSWEKVFMQEEGYGTAVFMFNTKEGVFIGNPVNGRWSIFLTKDGGKTWDSAGVKAPAPAAGEISRANSVDGARSGNTIMFGASAGKYYISDDRGKTWRAQSVPGATVINAIAFADSVNGMVAGAGLFKTTNGGKSWRDLSSLALGGKGNIIAMVTHDFWEYGLIRESTAADKEFCVYQTNGFGDQAWDTTRKAPDGLQYNHITEAGTGGYFFAVRNGGGISVGVHDDAPITDVKDKTKAPEKFALEQNYPNPFNPVTRISYSIAEAGNVKLEVYNLLGNQVAELVNENQPAGNYTAEFNGSSLPSGIYIYKLISNNITLNRKMMLVK
ncbi:MAG: T9SS type A sorting domain-containing protein, partial [Syntrophothermus sp.]